METFRNLSETFRNLVWYGLVYFDVLAKPPRLYLLPELRYTWFDLVNISETFRNLSETFRNLSETFRNLSETFRNLSATFRNLSETFRNLVWYGLVCFDVLAKPPGLYLLAELRYPWFGLVWYVMAWYSPWVLSRSTTTQNLEVLT